jgi:hypothetical protein
MTAVVFERHNAQRVETLLRGAKFKHNLLCFSLSHFSMRSGVLDGLISAFTRLERLRLEPTRLAHHTIPSTFTLSNFRSSFPTLTHLSWRIPFGIVLPSEVFTTLGDIFPNLQYLDLRSLNPIHILDISRTVKKLGSLVELRIQLACWEVPYPLSGKAPSLSTLFQTFILTTQQTR